MSDRGFTQTRGAVTSFTAAYGAPEQFSRQHGPTGPWTDVFALALVMVELLVGHEALSGDDFIQLGMASADPVRRPTPAGLGVDVGAPLEAVLSRALAVAPSDRPPTAGAFWDAVREAAGLAPVRSVGYGSRPSSAASAATMVAPTSAPPSRAPTTEPTVADPQGATAAPAARRSPAALMGAGLVAAAAVAGALFAQRSGGGGVPPGAAAIAPSAASAASAPPTLPAAAKSPATCPSDMAAIDPGKMFMGSDDGDEDERPAHQVSLGAYCMDLHEVTVGAYRRCSEIGECKRAPTEVQWEDVSAHDKQALSPLCNANDPEARKDHPINCVDWDMARTYCEFVGKRLPTEAEWEYAARGGLGQKRYP
jgi:hypothetical protein